MTTMIKLVSKVDKTVLAAETVYDTEESPQAAKERIWKRMMRQLKLMWVEEEVDAS